MSMKLCVYYTKSGPILFSDYIICTNANNSESAALRKKTWPRIHICGGYDDWEIEKEVAFCVAVLDGLHSPIWQGWLGIIKKKQKKISLVYLRQEHC